MAKKIATLSELARRVDRSINVLKKHLANADCPIPAMGPWSAEQLESLRTFIARRAAMDNNTDSTSSPRTDGGTLTKMRVLKTAEQARLLTIERKLLEGKLHDTNNCRRWQAQFVGEIRDSLLGISDRLLRASREEKDRVQKKVFDLLDAFAAGGPTARQRLRGLISEFSDLPPETIEEIRTLIEAAMDRPESPAVSLSVQP